MSRIVKFTNGADNEFFDLDNPRAAKKAKRFADPDSGYKLVKDAATKNVKEYTQDFVTKEISDNLRILGKAQTDIIDEINRTDEEFYE